MWSDQLLWHYPDANYLLIEAHPLHEADLREFCRKHPNAHYVLAPAADSVGQINFRADGPFGGQASHKLHEMHNIFVPATTVDAEVDLRGWAGPFLMKFDTHGFELQILDGALDTNRLIDVIVMECYNFELYPNSMLFFEMYAHMRDLGFRCIDLFDPLSRPHDDAFFQMDLVFVRNKRPEFEHYGYE